MDVVLSPWFAVAGAFAPQWRRHIHGGLGHRVDAAVRPPFHITHPGEKGGAIKLREAIELFAVAKQLDASAFVAAVCRNPRWSTASSKPFEPQERLCVKLELEINAQTTNTIAALEFVQYFLGVHSQSAKIEPREEFIQAKQQLLEGFGGGASGEFTPQFDLELDIRLLYSLNGFKKLPQITKAIQAINREVFNVRRLSVAIGAANYQLEDMTAFFQTVHSFRGSADVDMHLQLPGRYESHEMLYEWKPVFDLVARKQFDAGFVGVDAQCKQWDVSVKCRGTNAVGNNGGDVLSYLFGNGQAPDYTDTWLVAGCLSALANAGDHVTSVSLDGVLEDEEEDRLVRAKWLGYLLRAGFVEKLTITEKFLTMEDIDTIADVYSAPTKAERYRALFNQRWHEVEDEGTVEDDEAERFLPDQTEVLGLMQDVDEDREYTDVLLVGYGQCHIEQQFNPMLRAMDAATSATPERDAAVKSLRFQLYGGGDETVVSMTRFATVVGDSVEELVIEIDQVHLPLVSFLFLLDHCPRLRRLEMKGIELEARDDMLRFDGAANGPYALEALSVDLHVDEESTGLLGFCGAIKRFSPGLKELTIRGTPEMRAIPAISDAMDQVVTKSLQQLQKLHVASFPVEYFRGLLSDNASGVNQLETIVIEDAVWEPRIWREWMNTLANASHPVTRSLRTLRVAIEDAAVCSPEHATTMLRGNHLLQNVRLVFPVDEVDTKQIRSEALETNCLGVHRRKAPLPVADKLALLGSLDKLGWRWESQCLSKIFEYAAVTETRNVVISFKK